MDSKVNDNPAEFDRVIRQIRARQAIARIREEARRNGTDRLTADEIDAEIRAARAERRSEPS